MTLVVVKLASSSSEESLALCAIATVDQAVRCVEDLAAKEVKMKRILPYAQLEALLWLQLPATEVIFNIDIEKMR